MCKSHKWHSINSTLWTNRRTRQQQKMQMVGMVNGCKCWLYCQLVGMLMHSKQEEWTERYKSKCRWRKSGRKTRAQSWQRSRITTGTKYGNYLKHRRLEPIYGNEIKMKREKYEKKKNRIKIFVIDYGQEQRERRKLHDNRSKSVSTWTSFWLNNVCVCDSNEERDELFLLLSLL